jgi:hypothetical protein
MSDDRPSVLSRITDARPSQSYQSKLWGSVAVLISVAISYAVGRFEPRVAADALGFSAGVVVFVGWVFWSELRRPWYWTFMVAVVALHGAVLLIAPWPPHYETSKRDLVFVVGDFILMFALGGFLVRMTGRRSTGEGT